MAKRGTFIGSAYVAITGDDSQLGKVLAGVRKKMVKLGEDMKKFGLKLIKIGTIITAPLALAVKQFAALGDEVAKSARRTGLSTKAFSEFSHIADLSGSSMSAFEKGLKKLAQSADQAKMGLATYVREFSRLGVTVTDSEGKMKGIQELFLEVAVAIGKMESEVEKASAASAIFGRAGTQLIPVFALGAEGIKHYREEAQRLGVSIGPRMAALAERLTDMFGRLKAALKGIVLVLGNTLGPIFDRSLTTLVNLAVNVRKFVESNKELVITLFRIGTALIAVGAGFIALGKTTQVLSALVSPAGVLVALAAILAYVSGLLDPLIDKWGKVVLGFEVGGRTIRDWLKLLTEAWGEFVSAIKDIGGELASVFKAAMPAISAAWESVWETAKSGFLRFLRFVVEKFRDVMANLAGVFAERAEKSGVFTAGIAKDLQVLSSESAKAFARQVAVLRKGEGGRAEAAAGARGRAAAAGAAFVGTGVGAGARIADRVKLAVDRIGAVGSKAIKPLLETIFGEKGKKKIESFTDIFTGLGKKFREFQTGPLAGAAPALAGGRADILTQGTFSGRGGTFRAATTQNGLLRDLVEIGKVQNRILNQRLTAPGWTDEEPI